MTTPTKNLPTNFQLSSTMKVPDCPRRPGPSNLTAACALFRLPVLSLPSRGCASQRAARTVMMAIGKRNEFSFAYGTNRKNQPTNQPTFLKVSLDVGAPVVSILFLFPRSGMRGNDVLRSARESQTETETVLEVQCYCRKCCPP